MKVPECTFKDLKSLHDSFSLLVYDSFSLLVYQAFLAMVFVIMILEYKPRYLFKSQSM